MKLQVENFVFVKKVAETIIISGITVLIAGQVIPGIIATFMGLLLFWILLKIE